MSRRIILPDWVEKLKDRMNYLEDEMKKMRKLYAEISWLDFDVKSLKRLVEEKKRFETIELYAQGPASQNVPIIGDVKKIPPGQRRKNIHEPTFSHEQKIVQISKTISEF